MSSEPLLLEIKDLHVHFAVYGGRLKVLDGINFYMRNGEKVGLVGETGCGKTTTMKTILRVLPMPPARIPQGEIYFMNSDILKMSNSELQQVRGRGISMIFQDPTSALNPVFNVGEQIMAVIKHSENRENDHHGKRFTSKRSTPCKKLHWLTPSGYSGVIQYSLVVACDSEFA